MTSFLTTMEPCPCCGIQVSIKLLTSTNTFGGQTTDFRSMAAGADPLQFMVNMCPECGFASMGDFKEPTIAEGVCRQIQQDLTPLAMVAKDDISMQYAFCAKIAEWRGDSASVIAGYYLRAAWCCDAYNLRDHENEYRLLAADYFQQALQELDDKPMPTLNTMYLIGEMYRRVDDVELAGIWFNAVIEAAAEINIPQAQVILELAVQQRDYPRDRIR